MSYGRFILFSLNTSKPIGGMSDVVCHFNTYEEAKKELPRLKLADFLMHNYFELFDCKRREIIMQAQGALPTHLVIDVVKTAEEWNE
ncbi:hypothetical protein [Bacillus licheniformis]|uniref:hypothetical protein n=1 Tax=Bacillus licheniformis TaxID=1402 RepID=UPI003BF7614C